MFNVRSSQQAALSTQTKKNFEERLTQWLIDKFSGQFNQDEAKTLATQAIKKCCLYTVLTLPISLLSYSH